MVSIRMSSVICLIIIFTNMSSLYSEERHAVVIIGAGVSGFAAATTLLTNNLTDFVVLEASDRIGGRIHTVEFGGVPLDMGAEYVHGEEGNIVYNLVNPHGLLVSYSSLVEADKTVYVDITGRRYNTTLVNHLMGLAHDLLRQPYGDYNGSDGSVPGYFYPKLNEMLSANQVDGELGEAISHLATAIETSWSSADSLGQMGTRGEAAAIENGGDLSLTWKSRGYKTIFDILAKGFPNALEELPVRERIVFGKEVTRVDHGGSEVVVTCADNSSYRADHVVITVSLGVLKKRAAEMFTPPLPQNKTDAIRTLGMGCLGKAFLFFPNRWWPKDFKTIIPIFSKKQLEDFKKNSTHGYWTAYGTGLWPVLQHERMLCAWFSGEACRATERLTDAEVIDGLMELLNAVLGQQFSIPRPAAVLRSKWAGYPYTLGSYSFHTPDSDRLNITSLHLSEPILHGDKPVVMFGGEATHPHYWGLVHGALETGVREAQRLLDYRSGHQTRTSS